MAFEYEPSGWMKKAAFLVVGISAPEAVEDLRREHFFNYHDQIAFPCRNLREMSDRVKALQTQGCPRVVIFTAFEDSDRRPIWVIYDEVRRE